MRLSAQQAGEMLAVNTAAAAKFGRTPTDIIGRAVDNLRNEYGELFATLPPEAVWAEKLASWARLNIPTSHSAAAVSDVFVAEFYLESGLLALIESGTLIPVISTDESEQDLVRLKTSIAAYRKVLFNEEPATEAVEKSQAPTPEPVTPTESELDNAIIDDWRTLCISDVKSKCFTDPAYRARFDRLMGEGRLGR